MYDKISIIIPTLNEERCIEKTLKSTVSHHTMEAIIVDGGSCDRTVSIARSHGAEVIMDSPSRSVQMNKGALQAKGDILLFLHADTLLPEKFDIQIINCLNSPGVAAGAFKLHIESDNFLLVHFIEPLANIRSRLFGLPYGDQAFFVPAAIFHSIGGFPEIPIMEDFEFIRKAGKKGKIATLSSSVSTSSRRWSKLGIIKTTFINQLVVAAYFMGIPPAVIVRWYRQGVI